MSLKEEELDLKQKELLDVYVKKMHDYTQLVASKKADLETVNKKGAEVLAASKKYLESCVPVNTSNPVPKELLEDLTSDDTSPEALKRMRANLLNYVEKTRNSIINDELEIIKLEKLKFGETDNVEVEKKINGLRTRIDHTKECLEPFLAGATKMAGDSATQRDMIVGKYTILEKLTGFWHTVGLVLFNGIKGILSGMGKTLGLPNIDLTTTIVNFALPMGLAGISKLFQTAPDMHEKRRIHDTHIIKKEYAVYEQSLKKGLDDLVDIAHANERDKKLQTNESERPPKLWSNGHKKISKEIKDETPKVNADQEDKKQTSSWAPKKLTVPTALPKLKRTE